MLLMGHIDNTTSRARLFDGIPSDRARTPIGSKLLIMVASSLSLSSYALPAAYAQTFSAPATTSGPLLAQGAPAITAPVIRATAPSTILPTDVIPLPTIQNRMTFGENMQLRILQKLPARFYFTGSCETSFRLETNVFQFPKKRILLRKILPDPEQFFLNGPQFQQSVQSTMHLASRYDNVYRVLPSVQGGWTLTPRTRVYGTFFMIRDSLFQNIRLNTCIYSYGYGVQHDFQLSPKMNLQADLQFRELNQMHQHSVFDFLPGMTLSYTVTPRTVAYVNALMQIRGRKYFQAPTRELDPFYTWGIFHQRGRWSFSASSTFVQNFRDQFGHGASIPANNYSMISDFEIARRIIPQLPGLQAFVRAEPIWNMHSHNRPGLAGTDFRLYYGLRFSMSKPPLTAALDSLRRQLEEQEVEPPTPSKPGPKPSAFIMPEEVTAARPQPIHGPIGEQAIASAGTASSSDSLLTIHSSNATIPVASKAVYAVSESAVRVPDRRPAQQQIADQEEDSDISQSRPQ
jgi:hypothetical protein